MNYKHVIAFLGSKQQKDWAKAPSSLVHVYDPLKTFKPLVDMFPNDLSTKGGELVYKDGSNVHWGWINVGPKQIDIIFRIPLEDLESESDHLYYDPENKFILFTRMSYLKVIDENLSEIQKFLEDKKYRDQEYKMALT